MEKLFMEKATVKVSSGPVDFNTGANAGERIDMGKCRRVTFILALAAGTTPDSHTVSFQQHTLASSGVSSALAIASPYYHKVNAATTFTKVVPAAAASSFDIDTVVGDNKFVAVFEVLAEELTDGNRWISCDVTDAGGSQLGCVLAICHELQNEPGYGTAV